MSAAPVPSPEWEEIFDELAEAPPEIRHRRLAELEEENPDLAGRLFRMLSADDDPTDFLSRPAAALLDAESSLPAGSRVGSWRLLGLLGRGGMGEVYLAERDEGTFVQSAALKLIKRGMDSRAIVSRFVRERQILSRLDHPGIARLLDGGSAKDGRPFFVLERVEGSPITSYCHERRLGLEGRLRLMIDVCAAVDSAHRRLVVHRDLKPANILVTGDGAVKLLDFGIAKVLSGDGEETAITQLEARILTPAYAAPEQILGEPVTTATDVYALGVLLFELITGALPHSRDRRSLGALAGAMERETAERPSALLRRADPRLARRAVGDLDLIVLTALHRDPARRYPSAAALADDLGNFLASRTIRARPDTRRYRLRKFAVRHRLPLAVAAVGLLALLAGLGAALWQADAARQAARRADAEARRTERVKSFLLTVFQQSDPDQDAGAALSARDMLERGTQRVDKELAGEPATQAEVLDAIARIETNLGLFDRALSHVQRALALREAVLPPGDAAIAESRVLLGDIQRNRGDVESARRTLEKGLKEILAARGADSIEAAGAMRSLAGSLYRPEDEERGISLLHQALAILHRRMGDDTVEAADTLAALGSHLEAVQRYPEAERSYRQAMARLERKLGVRHPRVAAVQVDLAGLLDRLSRPDEARGLFEQAIATQRAILGPRHTILGETLFSYGLLLIGRQEHAGADAALRESLAIFGPDRYEAAHCLRYLGLSAMDQERYPEAAQLFTRAAALYERKRGPGDLQRWRTIANLGWAHLKLGRTPVALEELSAAVANIERLAVPESYELRLPLKELGEAQIDTGDPAAAIATLERLSRLEEKLFGTRQHREVAASDLLLAEALLARGAAGDRRAARGSLDESLAIFSHLGSRDLLFGKVLMESGKLALAEGDRPRARRELAEAEPLLQPHVKPGHPMMRELRKLRARAG